MCRGVVTTRHQLHESPHAFNGLQRSRRSRIAYEPWQSRLRVPAAQVIWTRHARVIERRVPMTLVLQETKAARIGGRQTVQRSLVPRRSVVDLGDLRRVRWANRRRRPGDEPRCRWRLGLVGGDGGRKDQQGTGEDHRMSTHGAYTRCKRRAASQVSGQLSSSSDGLRCSIR